MADERLIPQSIRDNHYLAVNETLDKSLDYDMSKVLVSIPALAPESALPFLAKERHVSGSEGWDLAQTKEEKIALLENAFELHRYKGTPYSLKTVLEVLNLEGQIINAWDYSGEPYHFKLEIDATGKIFDNELHNKLIALVNENKNERSKLDQLNITEITPSLLNFAVVITSGSESEIAFGGFE